jgi:hypothetical protein
MHSFSSKKKILTVHVCIFRVSMKKTVRSKDFTPSTSRDYATNPLSELNGHNVVVVGTIHRGPFLS